MAFSLSYGNTFTSHATSINFGEIELLESPPADLDGKVIVTFLNGGSADLAKR